MYGSWALPSIERRLTWDEYAQKAHLPCWIFNGLTHKMGRTALPTFLPTSMLCPFLVVLRPSNEESAWGAGEGGQSIGLECEDGVRERAAECGPTGE